MTACTWFVLHAYQLCHPHYMLCRTADTKHTVSHVPVHAARHAPFIMFVAITEQCPGLSLGALCTTILALVSVAGGFCTITTKRQMRSRCGSCYRSSRSRVIVCFVPGVGSCLCLQDASTDLRPYTRPFVSLVFQVYTLDHPLADLHAFSLGSWPAAFPQPNLGSGSDALTVKQLSVLSIAAWQDFLRDAWQCISCLQAEPHVLSIDVHLH